MGEGVTAVVHILNPHQSPSRPIQHFHISRQTFVKAIPRKELNIAPNRLACFAAESALHRPIRELDAMLFHQILLLFGDRLANHICIARRIPRQICRYTNYLFLINNNSVSIVENWLQFRRVIFDNIFSLKNIRVHSADIFGDVVHWAGAVEGDGGDDVVEAAGLHFHHQTFHSRPFYLEDSSHIAAFQHGERRFGVFVGIRADVADVVGDVVHRVDGAVSIFDEAGGAAHDG